MLLLHPLVDRPDSLGYDGGAMRAPPALFCAAARFVPRKRPDSGGFYEVSNPVPQPLGHTGNPTSGWDLSLMNQQETHTMPRKYTRQAVTKPVKLRLIEATDPEIKLQNEISVLKAQLFRSQARQDLLERVINKLLQ